MLRTDTPLLPLCLLLLAGLLLGCGNRRPLTPVLNRAEALMEDHPDSAYALLRTIDSTSLAPGEEQARYALLYTQAHDKNYIVQTDDSLIQVAVRYYDSIGRTDRQALAYYLWGGVYRDLNRQADALERYLRAADLVQQYNDDYLSSRIFNNIGYIYFLQKLYDKSDSIYCMTERQAIKMRDTLLLTDAFAMRGRIALYQKDYNSAETLLLSAYENARILHDTVLQSGIISAISTLYRRTGNYDSSIQYAKLMLTLQTGRPLSCRHLSEIGDAYYCAGQYDSAVFYFRKVLSPSASYVTRSNVYMRLASIAMKKGNIEEALEMERLHSAYKDSVTLHSQKIQVMETEQEHDIRQLHQSYNSHLRSYLYAIFVTIICACIIVYLLIRLYQSKSHKWQLSAEQQSMEAQKLQAEWQRRMDSLQNQVSLLKEKVRNEAQNAIKKQALQKQTVELQRQQMELLIKKVEVSELHAKITRILTDCHEAGHSNVCLTSDEWGYLLFVIDPQTKLLSKFKECRFSDKEIRYCCLLLSDYNTTERTFLLNIARATIYRIEERICKKIGVPYAPTMLKQTLLDMLYNQ